jgi:hypothetical protein
MKKVILFVTDMLRSLSICSQKTGEDNIDKFTNSRVIMSNSETLYGSFNYFTGTDYAFKFNIKRTNDLYCLLARIYSFGSIWGYDDNSSVILLLEDKETVSLVSNISGLGGNWDEFNKAYYFDISFILLPEDIVRLKNHNITNVHIQYMDGFYDKTIKNKKQSLIRNMLTLIDHEYQNKQCINRYRKS